MLGNTSIILFILILSVANGFAQPIPVDPDLRIGKLKNGLTYYIRHNTTSPNRADFYLVQKVGSVLEQEDQRGLAHFLEHMAFNGTKNFPGNTLVTELEKKGIRFGANINASTSYDQTVYKLINIPVNRVGIRDTALLVLHDWSGFLTLNEHEINKERGVVLEEWRTRSTGALRVLENGIFPVVYAGTPYANRIPIGSMDVINHFKPEQLRNYYKKWYRPDLQGIILVGDIDPDEAETKIKKLFEDIPAPVNPAKRPWFNIADNDKPVIAIAADPELRDINMDVYWKMDNIPMDHQSATQHYKTKLLNKVVSNLLFNRYTELRGHGDLPFKYVNVSIGNFIVANTRQALNLKMSPIDNNNTLKALRAGLMEIERMRLQGFSTAELDIYKKGALRLAEMDYAGRNNKQNFEYTMEYIQSFIDDQPIPDADWKYNTIKKFLSEISIDTINSQATRLISDKNVVITITGPEKPDIRLPTTTQILATRDSARSAKFQPYQLSSVSNKLTDVKVIPGKIIKTEKKPFDYIQWTLSNGLKVQFKNTGYPENKLILFGYSPGGLSSVKDEDLPSALAMQGVINEGGSGDPEGNAIVMAYLNKYDETISGKTNNLNDLKTLFQLTYLKMTGLQKQQTVFDNYIRNKRTELNEHSSDPKDIFRDTLRMIMNNHHPRAITMDDTGTLDKVNYDTLIRIYKERFGNAGDFTFFLTGNVSVDSIKPLVETWFGGLPSNHKKDSIVDHGMYPPKGIVKNHFKTIMKIPQSTVTIGYLGEIPFNTKNQILMQYLRAILSTVYLGRMREEEGGTYGAGVSGTIDKFPRERFIFQVYFDANPLKKEKLIEIVYDEIKRLRKAPPSAIRVSKVRENLLKHHREAYAQKDAEYWANRAWAFFVYGIDEQSDYEKIALSITPTMISTFAEKLFSQGNLIEVIMDPVN